MPAPSSDAARFGRYAVAYGGAHRGWFVLELRPVAAFPGGEPQWVTAAGPYTLHEAAAIEAERRARAELAAAAGAVLAVVDELEAVR